MPTQTITPVARTHSTFTAEVLDFSPMRDQALQHYFKDNPEANKWPEEKKQRMMISTEVRWARVIEPEDQSIFVLNEKGEGSTKPLSSAVRVNIALFASLKASPTEPGFVETKPFASVQIDDVTARNLPTIGSIRLDQFIADRLPEYEQSFQNWTRILKEHRDRLLRTRSKRTGENLVAPQLDAPVTQEEAPTPLPSTDGAMPPPRPPTRRGISM